MSKTLPILTTVPLSFALLSCAPTVEIEPESPKVEKLDVADVPNVYRLTPRLLTGGAPAGEAGFSELKEMGVTTIVSVAESPPDEETARKLGIHYIHVPLTYEGVSKEQRERILDAAESASGPVYIHCNSGRNRAATAAAMCMVAEEGKSIAEALGWMELRGTDREHENLWKAVRDTDARPPAAERKAPQPDAPQPE